MRDATVGPIVHRGYNCSITMGGEIVKIRVGKRIEYFEMHRVFGPLRTNKHGDERSQRWGKNSAFWEVFEAWRRGGMKIGDDGFARIPDEGARLP